MGFLVGSADLACNTSYIGGAGCCWSFVFRVL